MSEGLQSPAFTAAAHPGDQSDRTESPTDGTVALINTREAVPAIDLAHGRPSATHATAIGGPHAPGDARRRRGRFARWIDTVAVNRVRVRGTIKGMDGLVLTTIDANGRRRTPVLWFPDGPHSWLVVASTHAAPGNPTWYDDVTAQPNTARIFLGRRAYYVAAEQLTGEAHATAWRNIIGAAPRLARYERRAGRGLHVMGGGDTSPRPM